MELYYGLLLNILFYGWSLSNAELSSCYSKNCEQGCETQSGKVKCKCVEGFTLTKDEKCQLKKNLRTGFLLLSNTLENDYRTSSGDAIFKWNIFDANGERNMNTSSVTLAVMPIPTRKILTLAHSNIGSIKFLNTIADKFSFDFIYESRDTILSKMHLYGHGILTFAFDWITENFYYLVDKKGIGVCSPYMCSNPFIPWASNETIMASLLVHPKRGRLIWSEFNNIKGKGAIMWASMDGSSVSQLITNLKQIVNDLSMEYSREILYFSNGNEVLTMDLKAVFLKEDFEQQTFKPEPLFVDGKKLKNVKNLLAFDECFYYIDKDTSQLFRIRRDFFQPESLFHLHGNHSVLAVSNPAFYETFNNSCAMRNCSFVCVLRSTLYDAEFPEAACICPTKTVLRPLDGECIDPAEMKRLVYKKVRTKSIATNKELMDHRDRMEADSLSISWALIFTSLPAMLANLILCGMLIHVIVTDYVEYVKVINQ